MRKFSHKKTSNVFAFGESFHEEGKAPWKRMENIYDIFLDAISTCAGIIHIFLTK